MRLEALVLLLGLQILKQAVPNEVYFEMEQTLVHDSDLGIRVTAIKQAYAQTMFAPLRFAPPPSFASPRFASLKSGLRSTFCSLH